MTSAGHLHRAEKGNHASKLCLGILLPCQGEFPKQFHQGWLGVSSRAQEELEQSWGLWWRWAQKGSHLGREACLCSLYGEFQQVFNWYLFALLLGKKRSLD